MLMKKPKKKEANADYLKYGTSEALRNISYNQCWDDREAWLNEALSEEAINNTLLQIDGSESWVGMIRDGRIAKAIRKRLER